MKERILHFLKSENKSSAQLAEEIGVQPSGISHILSGRNKPSLDFVLKMFEKYKFLSVEWLLFGKGSMYSEPDMQKLFDESLNSTPDTVDKQDKVLTKPVTATELFDNKEVDSEYRSPEVEKIVWFFNDNSFREYFPESR